MLVAGMQLAVGCGVWRPGGTLVGSRDGTSGKPLGHRQGYRSANQPQMLHIQDKTLCLGECAVSLCRWAPLRDQHDLTEASRAVP
jgi:hypothetical protein